MERIRTMFGVKPSKRGQSFRLFLLILSVSIFFILFVFPRPFHDQLELSRKSKTSEAPAIDLEALERKSILQLESEGDPTYVLPVIADLPTKSGKTVRDKLAYQYPWTEDARSQPYPAYIWQTWAVPLEKDKTIPEESLQGYKKWTDLHPEYLHLLITDDELELYVKLLYHSVPEVIEAYQALPKLIMRLDFFRYLILFARGGVYSDIDTSPIRPIHEWTPRRIPQSQQGMVIGIEADPDRSDWKKWYSRRVQFCQWTIKAKAGHPILRETITRIVQITLAKKKAKTLTENSLNIMEWTGPGLFTDVVNDYLNSKEVHEARVKNNPLEKKIDETYFSGITEPQHSGDIVILPITGFSPGIQHMGAGDIDDPQAMVHHLFLGSWK